MSNIYKFSDIAELKSEKINVNTLSVEQYITTDNMLPNLGGVEKVEKLPNTKRCNSFKKGDILFSNIRTYFRKVWLAEFDGGCSADVLIIKSKNERILLNDYLYLIICSNDFIAYTVASSNGSKMPRGSKAAILQYEFSLPDIEEQRKIVKFFFALKDKISINNKTNQTLEQIAQAIFKSWFIDFDPVKAKIEGGIEQAMAVISGKNATELHRLQTENHTAYRELHQLANAFPDEMVEVEGFGQVPRGWEIQKIDNVIKKIPVGKKYSSKTVEKEGKVPVLDQGRSGLIGYHNDKAGVQASLENPVIVFANHTCYMRLIAYDFSAIQNVFAFVGKDTNIYWTYLATLGKQQFVEYKGHFPDFLIKEIVVPNKELTESFGEYVKEIFSKIARNDSENKTLSDLRDLLLPKLLSGEV